MPTDPRASERAALGARCRELLNNETFTSAMQAVNQDYERKILASAAADREKREQLFLEYDALRRVLSRLHQWIEDGTLAQAEMDRESN